MAYKVQTTATPTYLSELLQTHAQARTLRSSDAPVLIVPRIHNELAVVDVCDALNVKMDLFISKL